MSSTNTRLLAKEQPHHVRAFEHYYALGEQRSYGRVAVEFSVATSTVKLWARSFGWQERARERDLEIAREVADRTVTGEVDRRERSLQIVHMALVQLAKAIAEGAIRMTLSDLDKLIRLEAFLIDEPESRHELVVSELRGKSDKELREIVRQEVDVLGEIGIDAGMDGG
ncbi:MAG TPA: hypothetical protein VFX92_13285 [Candidatus Krumholzibacteria bacterium]|nr:hypothetical protein [Candidatus Krumholzibacteria bacterium]